MLFSHVAKSISSLHTFFFHPNVTDRQTEGRQGHFHPCQTGDDFADSPLSLLFYLLFRHFSTSHPNISQEAQMQGWTTTELPVARLYPFLNMCASVKLTSVGMTFRLSISIQDTWRPLKVWISDHFSKRSPSSEGKAGTATHGPYLPKSLLLLQVKKALLHNTIFHLLAMG